MNHSARRVNALASELGARRYLEIGVAEGRTLRDVAMPERTAVDPQFLFEISTMSGQAIRFCQQTSDAFFAAEPRDRPYDVMFIDGLHEFNQVVRDFANAVLRMHPRSVILLDDTLPSDVYSTLLSPSETMKYRKEANNPNIDWHGDVFKIVFYIHDFWPGMNYRTIVGSGNPQTLVWRAGGIARPPRFNDLERISRLTYFDLRDNFDVMRPAREQEAIALCVAETRTP